jgi:NAD(P)-dependent dehydrogenase (short-subunit alcohol dehydrogenase family)
MIMTDRLCLVTGATAGIGRVTAHALAAMGAEVVVAGRNPPKAEATVRQIVAETGNPHVHFLIADFSVPSTIREMARQFRQQFDRLDVLVNNAGGFYPRRRETADGIEMTFAVNHLGPFLLTNLVLDVMVESAPARIVNVSSAAHRMGTLDFDDLGFRRGYSGMKAYGRSKLANVLFTYELARRLEGTGVTVNALHPGHVATDIWRSNFPLIGWLVKPLMQLVAVGEGEGAQTSIYLACSAEVEGVTGQYLVNQQPVNSSAESYAVQVAQRLWDTSASIVGLDN